MRTDDGSTTVNVAPGSVKIDAIEPRRHRSVTLTTTDDAIGTNRVTGSSDVVRCF